MIERAHPVKVERHYTKLKNHHTNTGIRAVKTYQETPHGLFVSREFDKHPRIRRWQANLLPAHNLVVCHYEFHGLREHDYYIDVAQISREGHIWSVRDLYLDIVVHDGLIAEIVDADELEAAHKAGFIGQAEVARANLIAQNVLQGLKRNNYTLAEWQAELKLALTWDKFNEVNLQTNRA